MQWMAEPVQNKRVQIGVWVMFFLLMFAFIAWRLNAVYWKDVK
jgi:ubiquinol-cytochrome c reductase cytochrome c1 subunit